jgi:single-strand DNA-binding protein
MLIVFGQGRLTRSPEMNKSACKFAVACDYYMGEKKTSFLNCVAFGKRGESLYQYLHKGDPVTFQGLLEIKEYEGKYYTTCVINDLTLPPKKSSGYQEPAAQDDPDDCPF